MALSQKECPGNQFILKRGKRNGHVINSQIVAIDDTKCEDMNSIYKNMRMIEITEGK